MPGPCGECKAPGPFTRKGKGDHVEKFCCPKSDRRRALGIIGEKVGTKRAHDMEAAPVAAAPAAGGWFGGIFGGGQAPPPQQQPPPPPPQPPQQPPQQQPPPKRQRAPNLTSKESLHYDPPSTAHTVVRSEPNSDRDRRGAR